MTKTPSDSLPLEVQEALREVQRLNASLGLARSRYYKALGSDDSILNVAFRLYQLRISLGSDWPADVPVTWEDWWELTIEQERDEFLSLAADLVSWIESGEHKK